MIGLRQNRRELFRAVTFCVRIVPLEHAGRDVCADCDLFARNGILLSRIRNPARIAVKEQTSALAAFFPPFGIARSDIFRVVINIGNLRVFEIPRRILCIFASPFVERKAQTKIAIVVFFATRERKRAAKAARRCNGRKYRP